jgi:hypothetical protein
MDYISVDPGLQNITEMRVGTHAEDFKSLGVLVNHDLNKGKRLDLGHYST